MKKHNSYPTTELTEPKAKRNFDEADLHLKFCRWVRKNYHNDLFIRHEREKSRSKYMGNLMKVYNSEIDMPDFELLENVTTVFENIKFCGLLIEFKRPGRNITLSDGITLAKDMIMQYKAHIELWERGRCAYFCNDFDEAVELYMAYKSGNPKPMQQYIIPTSKQEEQANEFLNYRGL